ncbi:hypothetical protein [Floccifex sp.]|uniref:hypothetical protein n=1 Tax=Floccifex sp. TaxID=2815810 RepID=UPI003F08AF9E
MKKVITQILSICLLISLCSCSKKVNQDDVVKVFNAFDQTLEADSGHITGTFSMNTDDKSTIELDMQIIQTGNLQVAINMDLTSGNNTVENYLQFFIKDGKTYLKNMDVTSQSVVENIGLSPNQKISVYNIFLDYTDDELVSLFESTSRKGNTITLELNEKELATLLDSMGTLSVSEGKIIVELQNEFIKSLSFQLKGYLAYDDQSMDVNIKLDCQISDINSLSSISFPDDLESY